jgi:hypothetical protein
MQVQKKNMLKLKLTYVNFIGSKVCNFHGCTCALFSQKYGLSSMHSKQKHARSLSFNKVSSLGDTKTIECKECVPMIFL